MLLAMAVAATETFTAAELLDYDLLCLELLDDLGDDPGPLDDRDADDRLAVAGDQEHLGEDYFIAALAVATVNDDRLAFADPELVATVLKNRVHPSKAPSGPGKAVGSVSAVDQTGSNTSHYPSQGKAEREDRSGSARVGQSQRRKKFLHDPL